VRFVPDVDDERGVAWLRRGIVVVLVAGLVACAGESGSAPADPTLLDPGVTQPPPTSSAAGSGAAVAGGPGTTVDVDGIEPDQVEPPDPTAVPVTAQPPATTTRRALPGFGEVVVEVTKADGQVVSWCLLLAETPAQTRRGLMEVTDPELGGYEGMLFRFDAPHDGGFYMRNTPQPLMIAYLDPDGRPVDIIRMEPCADVEGCPVYPPSAPYVRTIEVPVEAGGVEGLGIGEGASVRETGQICSG
jgi:uncharacterized membrane protein (UPF0127 family)